MGSPFGAFLDSTVDRVGEGFMIGAIGARSHAPRPEWGVALAFAAVAGSFLVSYARARAEALGLRGDVGLGSRAERVIVITAGLVLAPVTTSSPGGDGASRHDRVDDGRPADSLRPQAAPSAADSTFVLSLGDGTGTKRRPRPHARGPQAPTSPARSRRRGGNLNDVAVGILASRFAVPFESSGRKGGRPSEKGDVLLRMPLELKEKLARRARERKRTVNQLIVETLSERLGNHGKETMASSNGSKNGRALGRQGARRDHRRRQLRQLPPAGRRVLQGRGSRAVRARPHARRPGRLPRLATSSSRPRST